jgi:hypothetical protein
MSQQIWNPHFGVFWEVLPAAGAVSGGIPGLRGTVNAGRSSGTVPVASSGNPPQAPNSYTGPARQLTYQPPSGTVAHPPTVSSGGGRVFYVPTQGPPVLAPPGYVAVTAQNGRGLVLLARGQALGNNQNIIRIQDPSGNCPGGSSRYYNGVGNGQPLVPWTGKPGLENDTHNPLNYQGPMLGYPGGS